MLVPAAFGTDGSWALSKPDAARAGADPLWLGLGTAREASEHERARGKASTTRTECVHTAHFGGQE